MLRERTPNLAFAMGDVYMIIQQCDIDGSGMIETNEMQGLAAHAPSNVTADL